MFNSDQRAPHDVARCVLASIAGDREMLRYSLDNLGWADFERLIQALLKVHLGLGVEAWGGTGDFGRDAYFAGSLDYPTKDSSGTFVFQAKFVDAANAAGADSHGLLKSAATKEAARIRKRIDAGETPPTHYALFTNAPCPPRTRAAVHASFAAAFVGATVTVHIHDGADVCAWLDSASAVARAFPTILGFLDLNELLRERLDRGVLERSRASLEGAAELAKVFVPTTAYYRALEAVAKNNFVVLSGAPEAGKTAIGRMISLAQHARGWEIAECRDPEEIVRAYDARQPQCFFADDFFGRTEFDPYRARRWESELPFVLKRMNENHWLILTSRAHILHQGERRIDVDTDLRFPTASEVVIDASGLAREERARILYRHAKAGRLSVGAKAGVSRAAWDISGLETFTAERVRRLVLEIELTGLQSSVQIVDAAQTSFRNPSERSQKTFRALPEAHKWFLFAMLEEPGYQKTSENARCATYENLCPPEDCVDGLRISSDLVDAFLSAESGTWAHPSYRDVAIDELAAAPTYRAQFLKRCSINGFKIAVSWLGGLAGARSLPLLKTEGDWGALTSRAETLARAGVDVLSILVQALQVGINRKWISPADEVRFATAIRATRLVSTAHNAPGSDSITALEAFLELDDGQGIPVDWNTRINACYIAGIEHLNRRMVPWQALPSVYALDQLIRIAKARNVNLTPALRTSPFKDVFLQRLVEKLSIEGDDWSDFEWKSADDAREAAAEFRGQAKAIDFYDIFSLKVGTAETTSRISAARKGFMTAARELDEFADEQERDADSSSFDDVDMLLGADDDAPKVFGESDVDDLFSDL